MSSPAKPQITPQIKVAELLDAYPELEQLLIEMAPPFKKLRNPVLRRTVARVTSLEKAAAVADLPVRQLVLELRTAAGQPVDHDDLPTDGDNRPADDGPAPWVDAARVVWTIDADDLLNRGERPLQEVQHKARTLCQHELGLVRSSFRPAPLIDVLEQQGYRTAVVRSGDAFAIFVAPPLADPRGDD